MLQQLLLALVLSAATVLIHAGGIVYAVIPVAGIWSRKAARSHRPVAALNRLVSALLLLHVAEATMWAIAYMAIRVFPDFETAFYFSLTSYSTLGYGDVTLPPVWRLLGPVEAIVGVLMLGLSTGIIVSAVERIYNSRRPDRSEVP